MFYDARNKMTDSVWKQPLKNSKDSCYLDTALIALFLDPSKRLIKDMETKQCSPNSLVSVCGAKNKQDVIEIQKNFIVISRKLMENYVGSEPVSRERDRLRRRAKKCPVLNSKENFDKEGMNDPSVFLDYFLKLFPCLQITIQKKRKIMSISPLVYLETPGTIQQANDRTLRDLFLKQVKKQKITRFVDVPYLWIDFTRLDKGKYIENIALIPSMHITVGNHKFLLTSIITWWDYHYTVYTRVGRIWWYFDDVQKLVRKVGSNRNLVNDAVNGQENFAVYNGKLYFYEKIE